MLHCAQSEVTVMESVLYGGPSSQLILCRLISNLYGQTYFVVLMALYTPYFFFCPIWTTCVEVEVWGVIWGLYLLETCVRSVNMYRHTDMTDGKNYTYRNWGMILGAVSFGIMSQILLTSITKVFLVLCHYMCNRIKSTTCEILF